MAGISQGAFFQDASPFTTSSGDNDDVAWAGGLMEVVVSNDNDAITGIVPDDVTKGWLMFVVNTGPTNNLTLKNNDNGSSAGARIFTYSGSDITVAPFETALMGYDTANQAWHVIKLA